MTAKEMEPVRATASALLLTADRAAAVIYVIGAAGPFPEMQELL